jgi:predicted RNA polymerase sigma factor
MNRAIVLAETAGPEVALAQLDTLARDLAAYHRLHASRATMLRRLGRERRRYTHSIWRLSWRREHASADSSTGSEGSHWR